MAWVGVGGVLGPGFGWAAKAKRGREGESERERERERERRIEGRESECKRVLLGD